MRQNPSRALDYLGHILQAIERINRYTSHLDRPGFLSDDRTQDAVVRNLEIIGEACRNTERHYPRFAAEHPDIPWAIAYEMRNALAHGYFKIDLDIVWKTVKRDLPELEERVRALTARLTADQKST